MNALIRSIAVALALLTPTAGADDSRPLTVRDLFGIQRIRQLALSPDGRRVAYVLSTPRIPLTDADGPPWQSLHLVDRQTRRARRYLDKAEVGALRWHPDGVDLCFLAKRKATHAHKALYAIARDGGEARLVAKLECRDVSGYAWSPDGTQLALVSSRPVPKAQASLREKGFKARVVEEQDRPGELWLRAGEGPARHVPLTGSVSEASWSPDGTRLALVVAPRSLVDHGLMYRRVRIHDVATGKQLAAIDNPGKLRQVAWSPDGTQLALVGGADLNDMSSGSISVAPATGGVPRLLAPAQPWHAQRVAWTAPTTLLALVDHGVGTRLATVDVVRGTAQLGEPTASVLGSLAVAGDGTLAAVASAPTRPDEIVCGPPGALARLTDHHGWVATRRLGRQEVVRWTARDGVRLEGLLVHPVDELPGTRYPLVMIVHGGPESHYRNGWLSWYSSPSQLLAARGFAVFFPNYRGSTGRGVAFSRSSYGDPAGREFDDLVDAARHLVDRGLVDARRVGVTGGSYGGYASAWCATKLTRHFAAAVMSVGLSDLIHFAGTTDIPDEMRLVHFKTHVWERWSFFAERSPLRHVAGARTPILILHGENDTRVPPSQSKALYRYLKLQGKVPVRLVLYPGEGHGNRKAAAQLDYALRLLRWMEHYLKGAGGAPPAHPLDYAAALKPSK